MHCYSIDREPRGCKYARKSKRCVTRDRAVRVDKKRSRREGIRLASETE